jgi:hypothetical protein
VATTRCLMRVGGDDSTSKEAGLKADNLARAIASGLSTAGVNGESFVNMFAGTDEFYIVFDAAEKAVHLGEDLLFSGDVLAGVLKSIPSVDNEACGAVRPEAAVDIVRSAAVDIPATEIKAISRRRRRVAGRGDSGGRMCAPYVAASNALGLEQAIRIVQRDALAPPTKVKTSDELERTAVRLATEAAKRRLIAMVHRNATVVESINSRDIVVTRVEGKAPKSSATGSAAGAHSVIKTEPAVVLDKELTDAAAAGAAASRAAVKEARSRRLKEKRATRNRIKRHNRAAEKRKTVGEGGERPGHTPPSRSQRRLRRDVARNAASRRAILRAREERAFRVLNVAVAEAAMRREVAERYFLHGLRRTRESWDRTELLSLGDFNDCGSAAAATGTGIVDCLVKSDVRGARALFECDAQLRM